MSKVVNFERYLKLFYGKNFKCLYYMTHGPKTFTIKSYQI